MVDDPYLDAQAEVAAQNEAARDELDEMVSEARAEEEDDLSEAHALVQAEMDAEAERLSAEAVLAHTRSDDPENDPVVAAAYEAANEARRIAAGEEPEREWDELSLEEKADVLYLATVQTNQRLANVERNLMLLGQSFVRILQQAGELPEEGSQIEVAQKVPKMATKIKPR